MKKLILPNQTVGWDSERIFSEIFNAKFSDILGFVASKLGNYDMIEDVTMEVFTSLFQKQDSESILRMFRTHLPNGKTELDLLLFKIANNKIVDYTRSKSYKNSKREEELVDFKVKIKTLENLFSEELSGELQIALSKLTETQRKISILYIIEGFSHKEIASQLGIEVGTSKNYLSEAKKILRESLINFRNKNEKVHKE